MSELPGLPARVADPPFAVAVSDADSIFSTGRARRAASMRRATAFSAVAVVAAGLLIPGGPAERKGLQPTNRVPNRPPATGPSGSPGGGAPDGRSVPGDGPGVRGRASGPGAATGERGEPSEPSATPSASASVSPSASGSPAPEPTEPAERPAGQGATRRFVDDRPTEPCDPGDRDVAAADGWCVRLEHPDVVKVGAGATLAVELCRPAPAGAGTIEFPDAAEALFGISSTAGSSSWTWYTIVAGRDDGAHELDVPAGRCVRWTVHWAGTRGDGEPVPAGTYRTDAAVGDVSGMSAGPRAIDGTRAYGARGVLRIEE